MSWIEDEAHKAENALDAALHRKHATAPAAANISTSTPGGTMANVFAEAKSIGHELVEKLEGLDENAILAVEAVKASPTGVSIVNELAAIAHIPDPGNLLGNLLSAAKAVSGALRAADAATAATAAAVPAGPVVAGQA